MVPMTLANRQTETPGSRDWFQNRSEDTGVEPCPDEEILVAYLSRTLTESQEAMVRRHFEACPDCLFLVSELAKEANRTDPLPPTNRQEPQNTGSLHTLKPGETVSGRYRIVRFIAKGGMGEVYEAQDHFLRERIALKTLISTSLDQEKAGKRLVHEVQLARRVTHPNVCRILEFGIYARPDAQGGAEEIPFLTMPLLRGQTLLKHIKAKGGAHDPEEILAIVAEFSEGLTAIHQANIIHRDLKPENIMMEPNASGHLVPLVMDFGLACPTTLEPSLAFTGQTGLAGTAAYMAPEQITGEPATVRSDVYALGVMLFQMLTGRLPFAESTPIATALKKLRTAPPAPADVIKGIPPHWNELIRRCLSAHPNQRPATIADVVVGLREKPTRAGRRWRGVAAAVAGLGLMAFAVATIGTTPPPSKRSDTLANVVPPGPPDVTKPPPLPQTTAKASSQDVFQGVFQDTFRK